MAPPPLHLPPYLVAPTATAPRPAPPSRAPPSPFDHRASDFVTEALGAESLNPDNVATMDDVAAVDGRVIVPPCKRQHPPGDVVRDDGDQGFRTTLSRTTRSGRAFPPPISVIGKSGRPWLSLRAHREGGRLVLREMRLPSQELLQPCREDGRFKLLMHPEAGGRCVAGAGSHAAAQD